MIHVKQHLDLLGRRVRDKVTGLEGIVASISFDLYGCVLAALNPGLDKDKKLQDSIWFDVARLELIAKGRVMDPPNYDVGIVAEGRKGAAEKPRLMKP